MTMTRSRFGGVTRLCRACRLPLLAGETGRCAHCDPPAAPIADVMVCVDCRHRVPCHDTGRCASCRAQVPLFEVSS